MRMLISLLLVLSAATSFLNAEKKPMTLTPVLFVDNIENSLPFWVDGLGFKKLNEVRDGDRLGFVMLANESATVMLQTWESLRKDMPSAVPKEKTTGASLFIVVDDLAATFSRVKNYTVVFPERTTFYGMREIGLREPGGHFVVLASPARQ